MNIYWKGAAEMVLASCTQYYDSDGRLQSLDGEKVGKICLLPEIIFFLDLSYTGNKKKIQSFEQSFVSLFGLVIPY